MHYGFNCFWREILMSLDEEKKKLWETVLDKNKILKKDEEELPRDPRSQIDKIYEQLDIDKQYEEARREKGETDEEKPLC